jgi:two-component system, NarL family, sensor kinase
MQDKLSEVTLILFGSTVIILLLTGLIVFSLFINQKRKFRFRQDKLVMKNNFDQELLRSQIEIQSEAFENISRELHDNVGTLISIAIVHIKSLSAAVQAKEQQTLTEADSLLNEAMSSLRDISKSIHPENISRLGWQRSFIDELEKIRKTNLFAVHYTEDGQPIEIELDKQVIIFRILQESLNNVVKHSNGNTIHARIRFFNKEVVITIEDDGQGLGEIQAGVSAKGSGIKNMIARAGMLPALLVIENGAKRGTIITLTYKEPF